MERPFTNQQVNQIIRAYRSSIADLQTISNYYSECEQRCKQMIPKLVDYPSFMKKTRIDIQNLQESEEYDSYIGNIILIIYQFIFVNKIRCSIKEYDLEENKIINALFVLSQSKGNLKWIFSSKKNKNEAIEAYQYLDDLASKGYLSASSLAINDTEKIKNTEPLTAWKYYLNNRQNFNNIIFKDTCFNKKNIEDISQNTDQQVVNIIQDFKNSIENLQIISNYYSECEQRCQQMIPKLVDNSMFFINKARREILDLPESEGVDSNIGNMILSIYQFLFIQKIIESFENYYSIEEQIKSALHTLSADMESHSYALSAGKSVNDSVNAYQFLSNLASKGFLSDLTSAIHSIEIIKNENYQTAWKDFLDNKQKYKDVVFKYAIIYDHNIWEIPEIARLLSEFNRYLKRSQSNHNANIKSENEVKKAIQKAISKKKLDIIGEISVLELNPHKFGIRPNILYDNGYKTLVDIFNSSELKLSDVLESKYKASALKKQANRYLDDYPKKIKLKLNADKQNKESTEIIKAVYKHKKVLSNIPRIKEIAEQYSSVIPKLVQKVDLFPGSIKWFFWSVKEKSDYIKSFNLLKSIKNESEFQEGQKICTLFDSISKHNDISSFEAWDDFKKDPISYFKIIEEIEPGVLGNDDELYGLPEELAKKIQEQSLLPEGLLCSLRKYQEWGVKYILHQKNVLLGDEMGLGKTIQAIATMVTLRNTGATHFIVVCPASVLPNWCTEISEKSTLKVTKIHGSDRIQALKSWITTGGVAVTTYETTKYFTFDSSLKYTQLVVDEAHYIKNPSAKRTKYVKALSTHAERNLFMTGTALENKVEEMINLIEILNPYYANQARKIAFMPSAEEFRNCVAPVYYRRKREDVLTELPELIESKEWCELSSQEMKAYEVALLSGNHSEVRKVSWNVDVDLKNSCKAKRLLELVKEAEEDGRKVIVFSFFLETIRKIHQLLGEKCTDPIQGSVSPQRRQEIIDEFDKAPAGKVLVAQITSGGTGLNIQSASVVIICEPQFKPSIENQAISRAYRMGQARNVLVFRLLCQNTVDEQITKILADKQAIFDAYADKSVSAENCIELDSASFGDIINQEIERIKKKNSEISA